jgi:preprotein translocase subunit SecG
MENEQSESSLNKNHKIFLILGGLFFIGVISMFIFKNKKAKKRSRKQARKIRNLRKKLRARKD